MWKHIGTLTEKKVGGCILAHSMGLGKSLQVCALMHAFCKRQAAIKKEGVVEASARVMLVVPSTLIDNWQAEFRKWVNKPSLGSEVKVYM
jgi:SNF2 family DNA or RNA helicase